VVNKEKKRHAEGMRPTAIVHHTFGMKLFCG